VKGEPAQWDKRLAMTTRRAGQQLTKFSAKIPAAKGTAPGKPGGAEFHTAPGDNGRGALGEMSRHHH
jgi:hypothetical protein